MALTDAELAEGLRALADTLVGTAVARIPLPPPLKVGVGAVAPDVVEAISLEVARRLGVGQGSSRIPARSTRPRRKDPKMSKALKAANSRFRKKDGNLRKGATQAKLMAYAHKLRRKM